MKKTSKHHGPALFLLPPFGAALLVLTACETRPGPSRGLRLAEGDIERGKASFVQLGCHLCHRVEGVALPPVPEGPRIDVPLGGKVRGVQTYEELVSSVIDPTHVVSERWEFMKDAEGKSVMPDYGNRMTVNQVADIVSFLQSRYKLPRAGDSAGHYGP